VAEDKATESLLSVEGLLRQIGHRFIDFDSFKCLLFDWLVNKSKSVA
jgi:hypothetical protein